jgi:hypothetical protein
MADQPAPDPAQTAQPLTPPDSGTEALVHPPIAIDLHCPDCGYNLRGLTGDCCPECGQSTDFVRASGSNIPWGHRHEIGRFLAYWRTVWMVCFRFKTFCQEIARDVGYADAQSFRWVTLSHACLPLLPVFVLLAADGMPVPPLTAIGVGLLLLMVFATGMPSYYFDCRDLPTAQRNNAIAMSYYCAGPVAWTILALLPSAAVEWLRNVAPTIAPKLGSLTLIVPLVALTFWWARLLRLMSRTMPNRPRRKIALALALPALWLGIALLIFLAVPLTVLYVWVLIRLLACG